MPRQTPHPQAICHLVPDKKSRRAIQMLQHPDNEPFVSLSNKATEADEPDEYGLEVGYHVSARPRSLVVVEIGRNADLVMPGSNISQVHFSFEIHPESRQLVFWDRSRLNTTKIEPKGFRADGNFRQVVLETKISDYKIRAGGEKLDQFVFHLRWLKNATKLTKEIEQESQRIEARPQNPRWARTIEDGPTDLPTWYNTRLHTPTIGAVQRTVDVTRLGKGAFGEVWKAADQDSGCLVAAKKVTLPARVGLSISHEEDLLRREIKILSSVSHKNIVEYLGSSGWDTGEVQIYLSLKAGSVYDLLQQNPRLRADDNLQLVLFHEMLEALDYLAFRGWIHRDVKLENILYSPIGPDSYLFQLTDFGFAHQHQLAKTRCGSPLYMAPEIWYQAGQQSPKADVWSLFITIGVLRHSGGLHERLSDYKEVQHCARVAAEQMPHLSAMAREDPNLRASAAQMLVACFNGEGLSTPRPQIRPIPDLASTQ
ncbi:hypothetical protein DV735_g1410, partial [Chaetothyriales sp. CBS 134920]